MRCSEYVSTRLGRQDPLFDADCLWVQLVKWLHRGHSVLLELRRASWCQASKTSPAMVLPKTPQTNHQRSNGTPVSLTGKHGGRSYPNRLCLVLKLSTELTNESLSLVVLMPESPMLSNSLFEALRGTSWPFFSF